MDIAIIGNGKIINRMDGYISRKAILKHIEKTRQDALMMDDIRKASIIMNGMDMGEEAVMNQPFAQSEIILSDSADINHTTITTIANAYDEIAELREMIERLKGKPYYMKVQCHNCGAPLVIDSSDHLIKCKYCHTAYFSGTQLVDSDIEEKIRNG